ncbi:MAG: hypothetical protein ACRDHL_11565 [Candidatus Promineifilaceae bacterium]
MPALVHVGATITCPHGGMATIIPSQGRVLLSGQPAASLADQALVAGCAFSPGGPSPCVRIQWVTAAGRVLINGAPAILQSSQGLGLNPAQAPQGPAVIAAVQPRVQGL